MQKELLVIRCYAKLPSPREQGLPNGDEYIVAKPDRPSENRSATVEIHN